MILFPNKFFKPNTDVTAFSTFFRNIWSIVVTVLGMMWSWFYWHDKGWRRILTEDSQLYFSLERPPAHDVGCLTAVLGLVICSICSKSIDVLWHPPCCAICHTNLFTILVPNELCRRVSTSRFACQLHSLSTTNCFSFCVSFDVWHTWWIWRPYKKQILF